MQSPRKHTAGLQKRGLSLNWLRNWFEPHFAKITQKDKSNISSLKSMPFKEGQKWDKFQSSLPLALFLLIEAFKNYYWPLSDHCTSTITADTSKKEAKKSSKVKIENDRPVTSNPSFHEWSTAIAKGEKEGETTPLQSLLFFSQ